MFERRPRDPRGAMTARVRSFARCGAAAFTVVALAACPPLLPDVAAPDGGFGVGPLKHAHNDYAHAHPLEDALAAGFESVEADLWLDGAELGVSHDGRPFKGSLRELYLQPLASRVAARGAVQDSAVPFFLWLDLKQDDAQLRALLVEQLARFPALFTQFRDDGPPTPGPVTVLLTGDAKAKAALAALPGPRQFARDSNDYRPDDAAADGRWVAYALSCPAFLTLDAQGSGPATQVRQLENLVHGAHAKGRWLRLFGCPETSGWWRLARRAGVDFVGGDDLNALRGAFSD